MFESKLGCQREQNQGLSNDLEKVKEIAEQKKQCENVLTNKILKQVQNDYDHLQYSYLQYKEQLKQKINELTGMYGKSYKQIYLLQQQQKREQNEIKRLQMNQDNEEQNHELEVKDIHQSNQLFIEFLEQELLEYNKHNQQLKFVNQQLENKHQIQEQFLLKNFRELECKTKMLGEEWSKLNNIIKQRDYEMYRLQVQLKEVNEFEWKKSELRRIIGFIINKRKRDKYIKTAE